MRSNRDHSLLFSQAKKITNNSFVQYFKKAENTSENIEDITMTIAVTSATKETTNAELRFSEDETNKSGSRTKTCRK